MLCRHSTAYPYCRRPQYGLGTKPILYGLGCIRACSVYGLTHQKGAMLPKLYFYACLPWLALATWDLGNKARSTYHTLRAEVDGQLLLLRLAAGLDPNEAATHFCAYATPNLQAGGQADEQGSPCTPHHATTPHHSTPPPSQPPTSYYCVRV